MVELLVPREVQPDDEIDRLFRRTGVCVVGRDSRGANAGGGDVLAKSVAVDDAIVRRHPAGDDHVPRRALGISNS